MNKIKTSTRAAVFDQPCCCYKVYLFYVHEREDSESIPVKQIFCYCLGQVSASVNYNKIELGKKLVYRPPRSLCLK